MLKPHSNNEDLQGQKAPHVQAASFSAAGVGGHMREVTAA